MKYIVYLYLFLVFVLINGCSQNKTEQSNLDEAQRISMLKNFRATDTFMVGFMNFIHENHLEETFIKYESSLLVKKELADMSDESFKKYLLSIDIRRDQRCIPKEVKDSLFKVFFSNSAAYETYTIAVIKKEIVPTKEYTFLSYLIQSSMPEMNEALAYALENNTMTLDKRYFYLMCTVPFKTCN